MRIRLPRAPLLALLLALAAPALLGAQPAPITLQPGDALRITIWREQDLSGEFRVDENGRVVLPLLGERSVANIPLQTLREQLTEAYREHLRNPSIDILPLRRVHVLGEVNRPGLYGFDPTVTLAGAIALAGGATPTGDLRRIRVVREGQVVHESRETAGVAVTLQEIDIRSGDQIYVDRRGWFERNTALVVSAILSLTSIAVTLLTR